MSVRQSIVEISQVVDNKPIDIIEQPTPQDKVVITLRRSIKKKRSAIHGDYIVYLQESDYNIGAENNPEIFSQTMSCKECDL